MMKRTCIYLFCLLCFNSITAQTNNPEKIEVENIPGLSTVTVRWIVHGGEKFTIRVDSKKGGVAKR